ncbi:MAG TPA: SDR family oxidoreductase [Flavobacteriales bacterium]|nr:SDR family oxidoreductase [Flavobacteriales bacterium]HRN38348.1 SDR family oxidoreductase [Flavobacteriales bacterium]HRO38329.1 SDR family oxidoreductase [Flavobacteriales bacterium]HRP80424.1 SDR family oxidoreductase [Flavobacteriales bacterium]HRQ84275.1 SDR family oxidoreductase [Flavobacteriales bacterium]
MNKGTIVITGGAGGLGASCARTLKDHKLVITDYSKDAVDRTVAELKAAGIDAVGHACDITDPKAVHGLKEFARAQGNLKGLVHTAGVSGTVGDPKKVFDINLKATALVVEEFHALAGEGSAFVLFSSMMGHSVPPDPRYDGALRDPLKDGAYEAVEPFVQGSADTMYNFTKRGVMLLCKDNAMRYGKMGARIVTVSPGVIMTAMAKKALEEHPAVMKQTLDMTPIGRYGQPEDVANVVKFLLSDQAGFITGTDVAVDGGVLSQILK